MDYFEINTFEVTTQADHILSLFAKSGDLTQTNDSTSNSPSEESIKNDNFIGSVNKTFVFLAGKVLEIEKDKKRLLRKENALLR